MKIASKTKIIVSTASPINNGWHWHVPMIFAGATFVLKKTF